MQDLHSRIQTLQQALHVCAQTAVLLGMRELLLIRKTAPAFETSVPEGCFAARLRIPRPGRGLPPASIRHFIPTGEEILLLLPDHLRPGNLNLPTSMSQAPSPKLKDS